MIVMRVCRAIMGLIVKRVLRLLTWQVCSGASNVTCTASEMTAGTHCRSSISCKVQLEPKLYWVAEASELIHCYTVGQSIVR